MINKAIVFLILLASSLHAGVIFQQSVFTGESDIINTGQVHSAVNLGGSQITLNGVNFGTNWFGGFSNFSQGGGDFSQGDFADPTLDHFLSTSTFQNSGFGYQNLTGLTVGETYVYQMFLSNDVNNTGTASRVTLQGESHNVINFGSAVHYITAEFVATSTVETITFGTGSTSQPARMQFVGYALTSSATAVPEPTSAAFVVLGGMSLIAMRRKVNKLKS